MPMPTSSTPTRRSQLLTAAIAVVAGFCSPIAQAAPCASYLEVLSFTPCYGTAVNTYLYFIGDNPSIFKSTTGFTGSGGATIDGGPLGSFVYQQPLVWGSGSSQAETTGIAPGGSAFASSSANLGAGNLRIYGTADSDDPQFAVANTFGNLAALADVLTFTIPKTIVDPFLTFTMRVDGTISGTAPSSPGIAQAQLMVYALDGGRQFGYDAFQTSSTGSFDQLLSATFNPADFGTDAGDSWVLDLRLSGFIFDLGNSEYTFDFGHTAQVGLSYSEGISFASAGGLLAGTVVPVPEPETCALILGGLALLGWKARRRRA